MGVGIYLTDARPIVKLLIHLTRGSREESVIHFIVAGK